MMDQERLTTILLAVLRETLTARGLPVPALSLATPVDGTLGLESLDWAVVVVRLEEETGADPFRRGVNRPLRTVGDLVEVYLEELRAAGGPGS
jgi:hypothetical protein